MVSLPNRLARLARVRLFPTGDLGLPEHAAPDLAIGDELPLVLALQVIQTPVGPRIVQGDETGRQAPSLWTPYVLVYDSTDAAGNALQQAPPAGSSVSWIIEIKALTGSPTNIMYTPSISLDNGTTWYNALSATATAAGLVQVALGPNAGSIAAGNDVKANAAWGIGLPSLVRLAWTFTAGTSPTVHHRIWQSYS